MEENFDLIAQTRANYYTPGSPVQFVCVELLRGSVSGEHAVCLTFRNISRVTLTALEIHFKCKGVDGVVLCEDEFEYRDLEAKPGENFGMDDAVFVTSKAITSVDISLKNVYNGKRVVHLDAIKRVRLPAPKRLSPEVQAALEARMDRKGMKYMPQMLENGGWYCACGTFHPKEEDTVYCTQCGSDRILLQNALNTLLQPQPEQKTPTVPADEAEATRVAPAPVHASQQAEPEEEATRVMPQQQTSAARPQSAPSMQAQTAQTPRTRRQAEQEHAPAQAEEITREVKAAPSHRHAEAAPARAKAADPVEEYEEYAEDNADYEEGETMAEMLIRWVPPITAIVCAVIALGGFVYYQFVL